MERSPSGTPMHPATSRSPAPTAQELSSTSHFIHIIVLLARLLARAKMVRRSAIYNTNSGSISPHSVAEPSLCCCNRCAETDSPGVATAWVCRRAHTSGITASINDLHACAFVSYRVGGPNKRRHRLKMDVYDKLR